MIKSIRNRALKRLYERGDVSRIRPDQLPKVRYILDVLNAARTIDNMKLPGFDLHQLSGNLAGFYSVKVNRNWRIIFRFEDGDVSEIDYLDYH